MQSVSPTFDHFTCNKVRNPSWRVGQAPDCDILELDTFIACESIACDPSTIVQCDGVADWFLYDYEYSRCDVKEFEVVSEILEPNQCIGSVIKSRADVTFCNTKRQHNPEVPEDCVDGNCGIECDCKNEPILDTPFRISNGWICEGSGYEELVNIFWGVLEKSPTIDNVGGANFCATYRLIDYIDKLENLTLNSDLLLFDVTADQILAAIFQDVGLASSYALQQGSYNQCAFYAPAGTSVGDILLPLVQSELGIFTQDPATGVFQFQNYETLTSGDPVATLTTDDCCEGCPLIMDIDYPDDNRIVNRVKVRWAKRDITPAPIEIFNSPLNFFLANGACRTYTYDTQDAIVNITGINLEANTQTDGQGTDLTAGFTATHTIVDANTVTVKYCNTSGQAGYVTNTQIFGRSIITIDEGEVELFNSFSDINDCEVERTKEIDNYFVSSVEQATDIAQNVLTRYSDFAFQRLQVTIKAIPNLQLGDKLNIKYRIDNCVSGNETFCCDKGCYAGRFCEDCYVVTKIHTIMDGDCFRQKLILQRCPEEPKCFIACESIACSQDFICGC